MPGFSSQLLADYRSIGIEPPVWAYPLPPSIPFVGHEYGRWGGIMVYASAENLSHYERGAKAEPDFLKDERRFNRHRAALACDPGNSSFRRVHMAPFDNGSLLVATLYLIWLRFGDEVADPIELLESIAAANFCKFSISVGNDGSNRDYAGGPQVLASLPYVLADLRVLRPSVVIMPGKMLRRLGVREQLSDAAPNAEFIPIPQFNQRVVNVHLKKHTLRAAELQKELQETVLADWIGRLKGYTPGYPYRFLAEMDDVLSHQAQATDL